MTLSKGALAAAGMLLATGQATAIDFELCTGGTTQVMSGGEQVVMWGYGLYNQNQGDTGGSCAVSVPGPELRVPDGDSTLNISLRNGLPVPTSLVIAGQALSGSPVMFTDGQGRPRVRSFTHEAAANGGTAEYSWTDLKPGTYLYSSGTHPQVQVQMGLYGALVGDPINGEAYPAAAYDNEVILLIGEIDPGLHAAVANGTYGSGAYTSTVHYAPKYFMVNGNPHGDASIPAGAGVPGEMTLVRILNAGLENHSLVFQGQHVSVIAEDGNAYPFPREQYSVLMAAGKTHDALFAPAAGRLPIYDRRLRVGLDANLEIGATLLAVGDSVTIEEGAGASPIDVLANDVATAGIDTTSVTIVRDPVFGTAVENTTTGEITYTATDAEFHGSDSLTYTFDDNNFATSNIATVAITVASVNQAPIAVADSYTVPAGSRGFSMDVLANDSDPDGDPLILSLGASLGTSTIEGGRVLLVGGNSLGYTPPNGYEGPDSFTYEISDGIATAIGTVNITVGASQDGDDEEFVLWTAPGITSPVAGSTLSGESEAFTWAANSADVNAWWVYAGSTRGARDYYNSRNLGSATGTTVTGLPVDGSTVHVTLWFRDADQRWRSNAATFTASTSAQAVATGPALVAPAPGDVLEGASATFAWQANGESVDEWWLYVGAAPGSRSYYNSANLGGVTEVQVTGLPTDGSTVHMTLWYREAGGQWSSIASTNTAASAQ